MSKRPKTAPAVPVSDTINHGSHPHQDAAAIERQFGGGAPEAIRGARHFRAGIPAVLALTLLATCGDTDEIGPINSGPSRLVFSMEKMPEAPGAKRMGNWAEANLYTTLVTGPKPVVIEKIRIVNDPEGSFDSVILEIRSELGRIGLSFASGAQFSSTVVQGNAEVETPFLQLNPGEDRMGVFAGFDDRFKSLQGPRTIRLGTPGDGSGIKASTFDPESKKLEPVEVEVINDDGMPTFTP